MSLVGVTTACFGTHPRSSTVRPTISARSSIERTTLGLGVILDVVYNHFGPAGNFTGQFSTHYTSKKHHTEWGDAINFDSDDCGPVREFVAENAAYWIREFHIDGLRLDATQAIVDDSDEHIIAKLTRSARAAAGDRSIVVFSEDEKNRCFQVRPQEKGGWATDGLFNDDFHHACRVAATGNSEGYYRDYTGSPQELISLIRYGHLYQGQWNPRQGRIRGFPTEDIAAPHLIHYLQNHDQVANSARGYRTHLLTSPRSASCAHRPALARAGNADAVHGRRVRGVESISVFC